MLARRLALACLSLASASAPLHATGARDLAAGDAHSCAVLDDGSVACWGDNERGQLGVAGEGRPLPTVVENARYVSEVVAGGAHSCLLQKNGRVRCFGALREAARVEARDLDRRRLRPERRHHPIEQHAGGRHVSRLRFFD